MPLPTVELQLPVPAQRAGDYLVGDIVRFKELPLGYRVLTVGSAYSPRCVHIRVNGALQAVNFNAIEKLVDWRYDHVSITLEEWGWYDEKIKRIRITGGINARPDFGWRDDFETFAHNNLALMDALVVEVYGLVQRGVTHWSMRTIFEYLRHQTAVADTDRAFKLNNNYAPDYARLFLALFPEVGNLFVLKNFKRIEVA